MASPECAQWCCPLHSKPVKVCLSSVSVCLQPDRSALQLLCKLKHYCLSEVYKHASLIWSLFPVWWQRTESRRRFSPDLMTSAQEERHRNYSAAVTSEPSPADVQRRWTRKKSRAGRLLKDRTPWFWSHTTQTCFWCEELSRLFGMKDWNSEGDHEMNPDEI